jgi:protein-tyrosine phosphatase
VAERLNGGSSASPPARSASRLPLWRLFRALVRHPRSKRMRSLVRDAWWGVRGLAIRNPAAPPNVRTLLFVCKGNICRSPFAAAIAIQRLAEAGYADLSCVSAGFSASGKGRPPRGAIQAARHFGVALEAHRSTALSEELMDAADVVVVVEAGHMRRLRRRFPSQRGRIHLLPLYAARTDPRSGYLRYNIADPYGLPQEAFDVCYARIESALRVMLRAILAGRPEEHEA